MRGTLAKMTNDPLSSAGGAAPGLFAALVAEAGRRSRVCWLTCTHPEGRIEGRLVWHAWHDGALLVLSGDDQPLRGLESASTAEVVMRSKDTGGELVRWHGSVQVVDPEDESWDEHATALLGVRLNLTDPGTAREAWRAEATVVRIVPTGAAAPEPAGPLP